VMPCTVIVDGDLSDRMLDRTLNPKWKGTRIQALKNFPERMDLWETYGHLRGDSYREFEDGRISDEFYLKQQEEMDRGAVVMWDGLLDEDEHSAIQHCMNRFIDDPESFWSELQNDPRLAQDEGLRLQTAVQLAARVNGLDRFQVQSYSQAVTCYIDIQQKGLFYALAGWRADFTGSVIDYGTWPDQGRAYYSLHDMTKTLQKKYRNSGTDGAITSGLKDLVEHLQAGQYIREDDGAEMVLNLILIDTSWKTSVIRDFCRLMKSPGIVPAHGRYFGASTRPLADAKEGKSDRVGYYWRSSTIERITHVIFDTNFWKSFIHDRLSVPMGDPGSLFLFGDDDKRTHRLFAEHLIAEYRQRITNENTGRTVDEWKHPPAKPDNHFLDTLVGCAVGASVMGVNLEQAGGELKRRKKKKRKRRTGTM